MDSLKLTVRKAELIRALRVLGTNRRRRFSSVVPVWLSFHEGELRLTEERGGVMAGLPALGTWPVAGATVGLFPLRRAVEAAETENIELIAADEAVLVPTKRGHVALDLLNFGLKDAIRQPSPRSDRHFDLPLFIWAERGTK